MEQKVLPNSEDFVNPLRSLYKLKETSYHNAKVIVTYLAQISQAYEAFANHLQSINNTFHKEVSNKIQNSAGAFQFAPYLEVYMIKVAEANRSFGNKLNMGAVLPLSEFVESLNSVNHQNIDKMAKALSNLDASKATQRKMNENYLRASENVTKSQEAIEKLARESKPFDQIQKGQDKIIKCKAEADEAERIYKEQIERSNTYWNNIYGTYKKTFDVYTESEDRKFQFTKETFLKIIKTVDLLYSKDFIRTNPQVLETQLQEFQDKVGKSVDNFQALTEGRLNDVLESKPEETFFPYEAKKKIEEVIIVRNEGDQGYLALYNATSESDLYYILDFVYSFLPKEMKKQKPAHTTWVRSATNPGLAVPAQGFSNPFLKFSNQDGRTERIPFPISEENEEKIWHILSNQANRRFLVDCFSKQKGAMTNKFRLRLKQDAFNYLANFLIKLTGGIINDKDYDTIGRFIALSVKYYTVKETEVVYLYDEFRKQPYWEEMGIWLNIIKNVFEKKVKSEALSPGKEKRVVETPTTETAFVRKVVHFGGQKPTHVFEMQRPRDAGERDILFGVLKEVIVFLNRLLKDEKMANEFLIKILTQLDLKDKTQELIELNKEEFVKVLKEKCSNYKHAKIKRDQKKWGKFYHIYSCLDFLQPKDLVRLLELNHETRKLFKRRIYRTIFYNFGNVLTIKQRTQIWRNIIEPDKNSLNFGELSEKFGELSLKAPFKKYKEVIDLDVNRTFSSLEVQDKECIQKILQAYAAYDLNVGYVQGMNYLAGFIQIMVQDQGETFAYFVKMMDLHMKTLIYSNIQNLKPYWSKLDRMIDFYRPKLGHHFQKENLEAGFYSASWFLTIFVSAFKYKEGPLLLEKIWDLFLLDGPSVVFKIVMVILMEYEDHLLEMSFAAILPYLNDLAKDELSLNREDLFGMSKPMIGNAGKRAKFIINFGESMKNLKGFSRLFKDLSKGIDCFDAQLGKIN